MYAKYRILPFNVKVPVDNKKQQAIAKILSTADQEICASPPAWTTFY